MNVQMVPYSELHPKVKKPLKILSKKNSRNENNRISTINKENVLSRFPWPMKLMDRNYSNRADIMLPNHKN